jgi:hypothetical protein
VFIQKKKVGRKIQVVIYNLTREKQTERMIFKFNMSIEFPLAWECS